MLARYEQVRQSRLMFALQALLDLRTNSSALPPMRAKILRA
jgi:hypothetical protein